MAKDDDYWYESKLKLFSFEDDDNVESNAVGLLGNSISIPVSRSQPVSAVPIGKILSKRDTDLIIDKCCSSGISSEDTKQFTSIEFEISNVLNGREYDFSAFKRLESKAKLLEEAVKTQDGNAIFAVTHFLMKTLKRDLLYKLMFDKPLAMKCLQFYFMQLNEKAALENLLMISNNTADVGYLELEAAHKNVENLSVFISALKKAYSNYFQSDNLLKKDAIQLKNYIALLEWQNSAQSYGDGFVFKNKSAVVCLVQCILISRKKPEVTLFNPTSFAQLLDISMKQLNWSLLNVLSSQAAWDEIYKVFVKSSFLPKKTFNSALTLDKVIWRLFEHNAPALELEKYLNLLSDTKHVVDLAIKFKCHRFLINKFISQKDRESLLKYKETLSAQSEEMFLVEEALRSGVKWKN